MQWVNADVHPLHLSDQEFLQSFVPPNPPMSLPLSIQLQDSAALAARRVAEAIGNDSIPVQAPPPLPGGPAAMVRFLMNTVPQWV